jgi:hypothetical protein
MSGGSSVTGSTAALTTALVEPAVDPGNAATVNDNGSIPLTALNKEPLDASGNFFLSDGDSISLPPGKYYFTTLVLDENSSLTITGKTSIYVTGKVDASEGTITNTTQIPSNLQLYPMATPCLLSGDAPMYAVVYGPTADIVRFGGNSDFFGALVGKSLILSGGGLHGDLSVSGVSGSTRKASLVQ